MIGAVIIVFREVLEAGLIVGIILAATRGIPRRGFWVAAGILLGTLGATLVAAFAGAISKLFEGSGQELFNAAVLLSAVGMLAWHNIWMSTHGRELAQQAKKLGSEVVRGDTRLIAITGVIALAILREGSEVVLFLYSLLASHQEQWQSVAMGGLLGIALGAALTVTIYFGMVAIPVKHFFSATTGLITLLAAGLASQAVVQLEQGGFSEHWSTPLWSTRGFLSESDWVGRILHILIGYSEQPTGMQLTAYGFTFFGIISLMRIVKIRPQKSAEKSAA